MTLPSERTASLLVAEQLLTDLPSPQRTPRVPREVREYARRVLRHYPGAFEAEQTANRELAGTTPVWGAPLLHAKTASAEVGRRMAEHAMRMRRMGLPTTTVADPDVATEPPALGGADGPESTAGH